MARSGIHFQKGLSLSSFKRLYCTEAQCEAALEKTRSPDGFRSPRCNGHEHELVYDQRLKRYQCRSCGHQAILTADTIMQSRSPSMSHPVDVCRSFDQWAGHHLPPALPGGGSTDRSGEWRKACGPLDLAPIRSKPKTPPSNGKAERLIQTLRTKMGRWHALPTSDERNYWPAR